MNQFSDINLSFTTYVSFCCCLFSRHSASSSSESLRVTTAADVPLNENSDHKLSSAPSSDHRQEQSTSQQENHLVLILMTCNQTLFLPVSSFSVRAAAIGLSCRLLFTWKQKHSNDLKHTISFSDKARKTWFSSPLSTGALPCWSRLALGRLL